MERETEREGERERYGAKDKDINKKPCLICVVLLSVYTTLKNYCTCSVFFVKPN